LGARSGRAARRAPRAPAARGGAAALAALALLAALGALLLASPAAAKQPCWKAVVDDWLDNARVDGIYDTSCYQEAIKHLPTDVKYYSSAATDITRALQAVLLARQGSKSTTTHAQTRPAPVLPATTGKGGGDGGAPTTSPKPAGGPPKGGGSKTTSSVPSTRPHPATTPAAPVATTPKPATTGATTPEPATPKPAAPQTTTTASRPTTGPLVDAINGIGPKKADSFPLPLIILAAIAGLLVAAGAAGFLVRRRQSRGLT
jgi:hypothetical protein